MKAFKIIISLIFVLTFLLFVLYFKKDIKKTNFEIPIDNISEPSPSISLSPSEKEDYSFEIKWVLVRDLEKVVLYSNLDNKYSSGDLATQNNCSELISGGFYDKKDSHIGFFMSNGNILNKSIESTLFNGYFSVSAEGAAKISSSEPKDALNGIQSGPILVLSSKEVKLDIKNDENARRIVVAIDRDNNVIFLVIYNKSNPLFGPRLSELPNFVIKFSDDKNMGIVSAINLDGGSHSAFLTKNYRFIEVSTIGSFFCIKP